MEEPTGQVGASEAVQTVEGHAAAHATIHSGGQEKVIHIGSMSLHDLVNKYTSHPDEQGEASSVAHSHVSDSTRESAS